MMWKEIVTISKVDLLGFWNLSIFDHSLEKNCVKKMVEGIYSFTKYQINDFLPGKIYIFSLFLEKLN